MKYLMLINTFSSSLCSSYISSTETNIPTYPARPERKAPITKPIETKGLCIR